MRKNKWYRIVTVVWMALGFFIKIYWYEKRNKTEEEWEQLWKEIAQTFKKKIYKLEGLLIKVGQLLSVRGDLLPDCFIEEMKELVDQVPPSPWEDIQKVMEKEWGGSIQDRFQSIEEKPIASASIGEVYKGILKDGSEAAVKVQRPGIRSIIKADFQSLKIVMWCANRFSSIAREMIDLPRLYKEIRNVIERELDFEKEMNTAIDFKKRFSLNNHVYIPKMFTEHSTKRILVMEWVDARRITEPGSKNSQKELAETLLRIFMTQWLEPGLFHADPHEGNILVNQKGQIVLLDFGMIGEMTKRDAEMIQKLIEAAVLRDFKKMVKYLYQLGFILPSADPSEMELATQEFLELELTGGRDLDILSMQKELNAMARTLPIQVPIRFVFWGRSLAIVQGLIQTLCPNEDLLDIGKPVFFDWMKDSGHPKWKLLGEWILSASIIQTIKEIPELIKEPRKKREWLMEEQKRNLMYQTKKSNRQYAFYFGLLNTAVSYIAAIVHQLWLLEFSLPALGAGAIWFITAINKEKKWMKKIYHQNKY